MDALRGFAAFIVAVSHYAIFLSENSISLGPISSFDMRAAGVQIFFIISGLVIFMTLDRSKGIGQFWWNRVARLYPAYLCCLGIASVVLLFSSFEIRSVTTAELFSNLILPLGLFGGNFADPSYWTLTLEVCFYAYISIAYFGIKFINKASGRSFSISNHPVLISVFVVWSLIAFFLRAFDSISPQSPLGFALNIQYAHLFVAGMGLYLLMQQKYTASTALLMSSILLSGYQHGHPFELNTTVKTIGYIGLVAISASGLIKPLAWAVFRFSGAISYSFYLIHQVFGYFVILCCLNIFANGYFAMIMAIAFSTIVAWQVRTRVEIPAQRWLRDRYVLISAEK